MAKTDPKGAANRDYAFEFESGLQQSCDDQRDAWSRHF